MHDRSLRRAAVLSLGVLLASSSGSHFEVGTTRVICTATDGSGNAGSESFDVTLIFVAPHEATATWLQPTGGHGSTFVANWGRTIPIKVRLFVDGAERSAGDAVLTVAPCGGGTAIGLPLTWSGGRWSVGLDTAGLGGSCHTGRRVDRRPGRGIVHAGAPRIRGGRSDDQARRVDPTATGGDLP